VQLQPPVLPDLGQPRADQPHRLCPAPNSKPPSGRDAEQNTTNLNLRWPHNHIKPTQTILPRCSFLGCRKERAIQATTMPGLNNKEVPFALIPPSGATQLHPPAEPGLSHRGLRRLQSAHALGSAKAAGPGQPSLISQQRHHFQSQSRPQLQQDLLLPSRLPPPSSSSSPSPQLQSFSQRLLARPSPSPLPPPAATATRRHASTNPSSQRARSNSDAPPLPDPAQFAATMTAAKTRPSVLSKRSLAADAMSLERLIREGPPNGDVEGALESTRLKILDQGIRSDSDGMVSTCLHLVPLSLA
jgi:cell cycle arrest protein BUB2